MFKEIIFSLLQRNDICLNNQRRLQKRLHILVIQDQEENLVGSITEIFKEGTMP